MGEKRTIEEVNGGDNSIYSENTDPNRKAIHIHGGMEHNLARYAKYYSYGSIEKSKNNEVTRKIDHNRRKFSKH
jgi:murein tripeptide amidase MpaA